MRQEQIVRTFVDDVRHPVEVNASQSEHLAQWLSKRLGQPVTIPDLRGIALTFIGGRLLPTAEGPAAFLMYEDKTGTRVTFYIHPSAGMGTTGRRYVVRNGIGTLYWFIDGAGYAITGGLERARLEAVADAVREQSGDRL